MKKIMLSVQPKWVAKILNGEKTIEIRKSCPLPIKYLKDYEAPNEPIEVYIYCTSHKSHTQSLAIVYSDDTHTKTEYECDYYIPSDDKFILNGKVVAKFKLYVAKHIIADLREWTQEDANILTRACITLKELTDYTNNRLNFWAWRIDELEIFDEVKELKDFYHLEKPTQEDCSCCEWCDLCGNPNITQKECNNKQVKPLKRPPQSWCYLF